MFRFVRIIFYILFRTLLYHYFNYLFVGNTDFHLYKFNTTVVLNYSDFKSDIEYIRLNTEIKTEF